MGRLRVEQPGPAYLHFPQEEWCDEEYFLQLTSEYQARQRLGNVERLVWKKRRDRNEALDCAVYAVAALDARRVDFEAVERSLLGVVERQKRKPDAPAPVRRPPVSWVNAWKR
jgi:phage terminase large subunit GpA-like protein